MKPLHLSNPCNHFPSKERGGRQEHCCCDGRHLNRYGEKCRHITSPKEFTHHLKILRLEKNPIVSSPLFIIQVQIIYSDKSHSLRTMIDSRSAGNFIDHTTAKKINLPLRILNNPPHLHTIDEGPIGKGTACFCTAPLLLRTRSLHIKETSFLITNINEHQNILHDPLISFSTREIIKWSAHCHWNCITPLQLRVSLTPSIAQRCKSTNDSKAKPTGLPPHRTYDCTIDFLPGR